MTNYKKKNNMIHWKHNTILCTGYYCTILINDRRIFVVTFSHYCCIIMKLHINKWINKHLFTNLTHTGLDWVIGVYFTFQHFVSFIATTQLTGPGQKTTTTMHLPPLNPEMKPGCTSTPLHTERKPGCTSLSRIRIQTVGTAQYRFAYNNNELFTYI